MHKSTVTYSLLLLFILGTCIQCSTSRQRLLKRQYKTIYIEQFKLTYFKKLLQTGFNNSPAVHTLFAFDNSGFTEPVLSPEDYRLIERIVETDNQQMKADSIGRKGQVAEGAEGKHVFSYVLQKLEGKWLDSLAEKRYKQSALRHTPTH